MAVSIATTKYFSAHCMITLLLSFSNNSTNSILQIKAGSFKPICVLHCISVHTLSASGLKCWCFSTGCVKVLKTPCSNLILHLVATHNTSISACKRQHKFHALHAFLNIRVRIPFGRNVSKHYDSGWTLATAHSHIQQHWLF